MSQACQRSNPPSQDYPALLPRSAHTRDHPKTWDHSPDSLFLAQPLRGTWFGRTGRSTTIWAAFRFDGRDLSKDCAHCHFQTERFGVAFHLLESPQAQAVSLGGEDRAIHLYRIYPNRPPQGRTYPQAGSEMDDQSGPLLCREKNLLKVSWIEDREKHGYFHLMKKEPWFSRPIAGVLGAKNLTKSQPNRESMAKLNFWEPWMFIVESHGSGFLKRKGRGKSSSFLNFFASGTVITVFISFWTAGVPIVLKPLKDIFKENLSPWWNFPRIVLGSILLNESFPRYKHKFSITQTSKPLVPLNKLCAVMSVKNFLKRNHVKKLIRNCS